MLIIIHQLGHSKSTDIYTSASSITIVVNVVFDNINKRFSFHFRITLYTRCYKTFIGHTLNTEEIISRQSFYSWWNEFSLS